MRPETRYAMSGDISKDLVAGSGIRFEDRGSRELRGIPGAWQLFAVETASVA